MREKNEWEITIETKGILPDSALEKVNKAINVFKGFGIDTIRRSDDEGQSKEIIIKIIENEDISDKPIRQVLEILFSRRGYANPIFHKEDEMKDISVRLITDDEQTFELPDQDGECIDWFMIE